ncbi:MAG: aminodeoxychorismate lyase [Mizugakiibacter sp.]|uniref:aminodeoxychorismate lyase n=1 Tax=Mizugakiibacter sp. TaxID=1972610 RepID=UPI0031CAF0B8|nr:aminodeoxychorismate lyase [Xanthomonadaceae bacterium]
MTPRVLVDGAATDRVSALDRGLLYGDGLFETVRIVRGRAPLWARHMARLAAGCARLGLPMPAEPTLWYEAADVTAGIECAVARISVTRGAGARGYAPPPVSQSARIVTGFAAPAVPADWYARGIRVRFCELRLATQPRLAGLKHLNRLEQVLARAEWDDAEIAEGLLLDAEGRVVCATAANLFVVRSGRLATPALDRCGVAGVARAEVLARHAQAEVRDIGVEELMRADEIFLSSSVRGILPVRALPGRELAPGAWARALQDAWRALGLIDAGAA